jgi:hypothetical protein
MPIMTDDELTEILGRALRPLESLNEQTAVVGQVQEPESGRCWAVHSQDGQHWWSFVEPQQPDPGRPMEPETKPGVKPALGGLWVVAGERGIL